MANLYSEVNHIYNPLELFLQLMTYTHKDALILSQSFQYAATRYMYMYIHLTLLYAKHTMGR